MILEYRSRPDNVYPHWLHILGIGRHAGFLRGGRYLTDSDPVKWMIEHIGLGDLNSGGFGKDQQWWFNVGQREIGFKHKEQAMLFKLTWAG